MSSGYTHIHLHTDFSCLDGYGTVEEYAKKASENNVPYLCVTDHGMGAAYPRMIEECDKYGLKPVFGSEVYTNDFHHLLKERAFKDLNDEEKFRVRKNNHLLLLAKNQKGYENLVHLVSSGWMDGFYYKPRVSWNMIKKHSDGLVCSSACLASVISQHIMHERFEEAVNTAKEFKEVFGEDYYIELQMIKMEEQDTTNRVLMKIADHLSIPLVITNDVHYCEEAHSFNQTVNLLLQSQGTINNRSDSFEFHTDQLWYKTEQEMDETWEQCYKDDIPESEYLQAKKNTIEICEKCNVLIDTSPKFPEIPNAADDIREFCLKKMKQMGIYNNKTYQNRLLKEYKVICEKGYPSYFMCIKIIVDWAKEQGYSVGPGRGSGAGSLICYLLGITQVDPIEYDLLFERFLSPSRGGKFARLQFGPESEIRAT